MAASLAVRERKQRRCLFPAVRTLLTCIGFRPGKDPKFLGGCGVASAQRLLLKIMTGL